MQQNNKPGPAQVGAPLKFPKHAKDPRLNLLPFSHSLKLPQEMRLRLRNHFFPNRNHKISNESFGKTHRAKKTETRHFPQSLGKLISST